MGRDTNLIMILKRKSKIKIRRRYVQDSGIGCTYPFSLPLLFQSTDSYVPGTLKQQTRSLVVLQ